MTETELFVADLRDIADEEVSRFNVHGMDVAIYRVGNEVFATSNICTHGKAFMSDGYFENFEIECPLHQGRFDVRNGKALCKPLTENIAAYPIKIMNNKVFIDLPCGQK